MPLLDVTSVSSRLSTLPRAPGAVRGTPFDTVLRQIEVQADSPAVRAQLYPDLRVLEALVGAGHGLSLLPRGFVLRPPVGVRVSRSIVAVVIPTSPPGPPSSGC
ncbi:MAG: ArsR family transcriptional regulator [Arthrobacter sp.]|nr:ArsR family transcriptional regulator [Arthrobacter sp.]